MIEFFQIDPSLCRVYQLCWWNAVKHGNLVESRRICICWQLAWYLTSTCPPYQDCTTSVNVTSKLQYLLERVKQFMMHRLCILLHINDVNFLYFIFSGLCKINRLVFNTKEFTYDHRENGRSLILCVCNLLYSSVNMFASICNGYHSFCKFWICHCKNITM